jgi:hypothetical protein
LSCIALGLLLLNAQTVSNGFWYDADKPHTLSLTQPGIAAGICGDRWHVDYIRSGTFRSDAIATAGDAPNLARYAGHGWFQGVQASYDWRYASVGAMLYQAKWYEDTTERGLYGHFRNVPDVHVAPVVGLGKQLGRWKVGLAEYFMCVSDRCKSEQYGFIGRNVTTLSLTWRFHD